jgi:hypothetical protein
MKWVYLLAGGLILLICLFARERFVDTEFKSGGVGVSKSVEKPCMCPLSGPCLDSNCKAWESKVSAQAPSSADRAAYISVLANFYDTIYTPSPTKPTEAQVDTFLASSAGTVNGVDIPSLKRILVDGFHIDRSSTAAQREEKTQMFKPSEENLAPKMGVDQVRHRKEKEYVGATPVVSTMFSEGPYAPVTQTEPLNASRWEGPRPAAVYPSAENVI